MRRATPTASPPRPIRRRRAGTTKASDDKKFRDFNEVVKGATQIDGYFTLHRKDDHLYAEIKNHQLDQPFLMPIAIAQGMEMAGHPLNFGDEWVLAFRRVGDRVQVVRRNVHYKASAGTPLEKAVKQNYTDSVLLALPILAINHGGGQSVLIDFADIFLSDFAQLGFGYLDKNRSTWHKIKGFPNNVEIEVEATFGGGGFGRSYGMGDGGVIDGRGRTVVIHYSLAKMPDSGYHARHADDRVGHFLNATKDFGSHDPDTNFVRMVNRWRLEKADHKAKLSPPKKQIVWYVEDTVPHEYRPYVEEGIREWNKAFEKIGFRDAIAVRWQESGRDEFDPEDINYCTFRWITTNSTFAMSCLRSNPLTGEMIDGDVIFDASWIRAWKLEYAFLTGACPRRRSATATATGSGRSNRCRWASARSSARSRRRRKVSACRPPCRKATRRPARRIREDRPAPARADPLGLERAGSAPPPESGVGPVQRLSAQLRDAARAGASRPGDGRGRR